MIKLSEKKTSYDTVTIGKQTEYGYYKLQFDLSEYITKYGTGTAIVTFTRCNTAASYIIPSTLSNAYLTAIIAATETSRAGNHTITVNFYPTNGHIVTAEIPVVVLSTIQNATNKAPSAVKTWLESAQTMIDTLSSTIKQGKKDFDSAISDGNTKFDTAINDKVVGADAVIQAEIDSWLDSHPEATTTVEDGAITEAKISDDFLPYIKNVYVTPEMFGAAADGTTDDSVAINSALSSGYPVVFTKSKTYAFSQYLEVKSNSEIIIDGTVKAIGASVASFELFSRSTAASGYSGVHDVHIHGCGMFDANGKDHSNYGATPFRIHHCTNVLVEGITIKNTSQYHAMEIGGSKNVTIKNVTFDGFYFTPTETDTKRTDYNTGGEFIQIEAATENGTSGAIAYDDTPSMDIVVDGCTFCATDSGATWYKAVGDHSTCSHNNITIKNCIMDGGDDYKIVFQNVENLVIENNIFKNITPKNNWRALIYIYYGNMVNKNIIIRNNVSDNIPCRFCHIGNDKAIGAIYFDNIFINHNLVNGFGDLCFGLRSEVSNVYITENTCIPSESDLAKVIILGEISDAIYTCENINLYGNAIVLRGGTLDTGFNGYYNTDITS